MTKFISFLHVLLHKYSQHSSFNILHCIVSNSSNLKIEIDNDLVLNYICCHLLSLVFSWHQAGSMEYPVRIKLTNKAESMEYTVRIKLTHTAGSMEYPVRIKLTHTAGSMEYPVRIKLTNKAGSMDYPVTIKLTNKAGSMEYPVRNSLTKLEV